MPIDPGALVKRYDRLLSARGNFDNLWQELAEFIVPRKSVITVKRAAGEKLESQRLFDGTAIHANVLLAASAHGALTSNSIPWFSLKMRKDELNADKAIADWLEECEQRMYLALRQSNFASEIHELYLDLGAFGTGAMLIEERPSPGPQLFGGLRFKTLTIGEYVIDEAPDGMVDTLYRQWEMSAKACLQQWGEKACGEDITRQAKEKPETPITVLCGIYPRIERDPQKVTRQHMPFVACWIERKTKRVFEEGGYEEFPAIVVRWAKTSGEMYGRSPGMTALPDIRTLNRAIELMLEEAARAIGPPMKALNDGVVGEIDLRPFGITVVESMDALDQMENKARFDVAALVDGRLEKKIQHVFYWDQLQLETSRAPTATEIERRWELMRRVLGPTLGRLEGEGLNPIINRVFALMYRAGALPEPPEGLADEDIDVEYEGPLARSQKTLRLTGFEQVMALLAPLVTAQPDVLDIFDFDGAARDLSEVAGLPSKYLKSNREVAAIRKQRAEAQAKQEALAAAEQAGKAIGAAGPGMRDMAEMMRGENGSEAE